MHAQQLAVTPLTASFQDVPSEPDGETAVNNPPRPSAAPPQGEATRFAALFRAPEHETQACGGTLDASSARDDSLPRNLVLPALRKPRSEAESVHDGELSGTPAAPTN